MRSSLNRLSSIATAVAVGGMLAMVPAQAQPPGFGGRGGGQGGGGPVGAPSARDSAPVDLTGTWVSVVSEDWIERMSPDSPRSGSGEGSFGFGGGGGGGGGRGGPAGGDSAAVSSDDPCAAYGAGGIMRVPGRVRISWQDDQTMRLEFDAGSQRRLVYFSEAAAPPAVGNSLQGRSIGSWQGGGGGGGRGRGRGGGGGPDEGFGAPTDGRGGAAQTQWGSLTIETTGLSAGYLLSNKSWYRNGATLTELIRPHSDFGDEYFTVTAIVRENGATSNMTSSTFRKESDDSDFSPSACEITP